MFCLRIAVRIQRNLDSWRSLTHPCMRAKGACNHVTRFIVNANHSVPIRLAKLARFLQNSAHMKTRTLPLRNLMNRSPLRAFLLIPFLLACFALSPHARAVCREGCLTNQNTALGDDALFSLTTGIYNTAIGFNALKANTTGNFNTAIGALALFSNTSALYNTANSYLALLATQLATITPPTGLVRSFPTPSASTTRPTVLMHSTAIQPATIAPPPVRVRFTAAQPAATTQPMVRMQCVTTQPVHSTSH